ncbi:MAG: hypothetical protein IT532_16795 [Burkholderiales bacterium]|nr:hypothetical protein [Burkholderiales bacterium]
MKRAIGNPAHEVAEHALDDQTDCTHAQGASIERVPAAERRLEDARVLLSDEQERRRFHYRIH